MALKMLVPFYVFFSKVEAKVKERPLIEADSASNICCTPTYFVFIHAISPYKRTA